MKINKDYNMEFTAMEATYVMLGRMSVCNKSFDLPKTRDKGKMLAYLYGQNEALKTIVKVKELKEKEENERIIREDLGKVEK